MFEKLFHSNYSQSQNKYTLCLTFLFKIKQKYLLNFYDPLTVSLSLLPTMVFFLSLPVKQTFNNGHDECGIKHIKNGNR